MNKFKTFFNELEGKLTKLVKLDFKDIHFFKLFISILNFIFLIFISFFTVICILDTNLAKEDTKSSTSYVNKKEGENVTTDTVSNNKKIKEKSYIVYSKVNQNNIDTIKIIQLKSLTNEEIEEAYIKETAKNTDILLIFSNREKAVSESFDIAKVTKINNEIQVLTYDNYLKAECKIKEQEEKNKQIVKNTTNNTNTANNSITQINNSRGTNNDVTTKSSSNSNTNPIQQSDNMADEVWVGKTGNKYHVSTCPTLKGKGYKIKYSQAILEGRGACKVCKP